MRSDDATTRGPQIGAVVTIPGDCFSPYTLTALGWLDKNNGGNVYRRGEDVWAGVLDYIATLAAEVERVKEESVRWQEQLHRECLAHTTARADALKEAAVVCDKRADSLMDDSHDVMAAIEASKCAAAIRMLAPPSTLDATWGGT